MILGVCSKDLKFFEWPDLTFLGQHLSSERYTSVKNFAWSNESNQLLTIQTNGSATTIKPPSPNCKEIQQLQNLKCTGVNAANFSNTDCNTAAIGSAEGRVQIYNVSDNSVSKEYTKLNASVDFVEYLWEDAGLVVGCNNGQIILYNKKGRPCVTFEVPYSQSVSAVASHKKQANLIAGGSKEGYAGVWDAETGDIKLISGQRSDSITYVQFNNQTVSTSGTEGGFITYDLHTNQVIAFNNLKVSISAFSFVEDSYDLAVSTNTGQLFHFDRRNMAAPYKTTMLSAFPISKIAFSNAKPFQLQKKSALQKSVLTNLPFKDVVESRLPVGIFDGDTGFPDALNLLKPDSMSSKTYTALSEEMNKKVVLPREELDKFVDYIKSNLQKYKTDFIQNMFQKFYSMRIEGSKKFILLEDKIKSFPDRRSKTSTKYF